MKNKLKKSFLYLFFAFITISFVSLLNGYLNIKMMTIIDSAMAGNISLLRSQSKTTFIAIALLLPAGILASFTRGLYIKKALVKSKLYYVDKVFKKNINEFQADNNALYLSSITNDMNTIEKKYLEGVYEVGANFIAFIVSFVVIASVSPIVLLIALVLSILTGVLSMVAGKPLQKHEKDRANLFTGYTSYIKEVLGAFQIIKANKLNEKIKNDFQDKSKEIQNKKYLMDKVFTYFISFEFLLTTFIHISILILSAYMVIKGRLTMGAVVLIVISIGRVIHPLLQIAEWLPEIFSIKSIFKKVDDSLENHDNHVETIDLDDFKDAIKFRDVSFSYDENEILKDVSLDFKRGKKYLIVGPSGGGKSTLLRLLRKYYNPSKGQILIDGENLKDIKKTSYFEKISNIEQDVFLFEDSLKNNLTLYKPYDIVEINRALDRSGLRSFVDGLENGLDTYIYDNGKNISGGEKSRIAIARGLLTSSDIIFLDEAFASLDAKVSKEIETTLLDLEGVTVINVSHVVFEDTKDKYDRVLMVKNKTIM